MWTPPLEPCWLSPQPLSSFGLSHRDTFEPSHELPLAETLAWTILQKGQMQWSGQACFHLKVKLDKGTLKKMPFGVSMWSELDFIPWIRSCNVIPVHSHDRQVMGHINNPFPSSHLHLSEITQKDISLQRPIPHCFLLIYFITSLRSEVDTCFCLKEW